MKLANPGLVIPIFLCSLAFYKEYHLQLIKYPRIQGKS
jgi:hypothetical protein